MEAKELIKLQVAIARKQSDEVMNAITDEQFNFAPPGTLNSISNTFVHMLTSEDRAVNVTLQGKARVWDADGWPQKLNLAEAPAGSPIWDQVKGVRFNVLALLTYEQAVRDATDAYLDRLTPEELDRKVTVAGNERTVAEHLSRTLVIHTSLHTGEIAALKGMLGMKGLPR